MFKVGDKVKVIDGARKFAHGSILTISMVEYDDYLHKIIDFQKKIALNHKNHSGIGFPHLVRRNRHPQLLHQDRGHQSVERTYQIQL